jgi:hypothetical protein
MVATEFHSRPESLKLSPVYVSVAKLLASALVMALRCCALRMLAPMLRGYQAHDVSEVG